MIKHKQYIASDAVSQQYPSCASVEVFSPKTAHCKYI